MGYKLFCMHVYQIKTLLNSDQNVFKHVIFLDTDNKLSQQEYLWFMEVMVRITILSISVKHFVYTIKNKYTL